MDDADIIRVLEDEFFDDSGSELDDVNCIESDEPVYTDLLPVVEHFNNIYNEYSENLAVVDNNISNEYLNISVLENNLTVNENEHNLENAAELWGFADSFEEMPNNASPVNLVAVNKRKNLNRPKVRSSVRNNRIQKGLTEEYKWKVKNTKPKPHVFSSTPNILTSLSAQSNELDFFKLFFPDHIIKMIKKETNRYAYTTIQKLKKANKLKLNSVWNKWLPVKECEIYSFFAIILHMCLIPKPQLKDFWSQNTVIQSSFAPKVMPRDRFLSILSMLHLVDNSKYVPRENINHDRLFKIRPFSDFLSKQCSKFYKPAQNLTVDEGICPFRGRISFRVYMKNKPQKYGMKLYILSDPETGYTLNFEIYSGKEQQDNSICALYDRLLRDYYYKGHTIYMDRFYTSPLVLKHLWNKQTNAVGTVMSNRKNLPKDLIKQKLLKDEITFARCGPQMFLKWKDTRDVLVMSTVHNADLAPVTVRSKVGPLEKFKPQVIIDYNKYKTGVDHGDQMIAYYPFNRKTMKWWKKMFFHLFMVSTVNSFILHKKTQNVKNENLRLRNFMINLASQLANQSDSYPRFNEVSNSENRLKGRHFISKIPPTLSKAHPRRVCKVCAEKAKRSTGNRGRKETSYYCSSCNKPLCVDECFEIYHTKQNYWM